MTFLLCWQNLSGDFQCTFIKQGWDGKIAPYLLKCTSPIGAAQPDFEVSHFDGEQVLLQQAFQNVSRSSIGVEHVCCVFGRCAVF